MKLKQALGRTWYLEGWQLIPLYRLDEHKAILLDAGDVGQRLELEQTLERERITPIGIIGSHSHPDHSANFSYFQQKYHIPIAMSFGEAGLCASALNLKSYLYMLTTRQIRERRPDVLAMEVNADYFIRPEEDVFYFCGISFGILHTPGHSPDHISICTPDRVLYLGDALLSGEELHASKLPYCFSVEDYFQSLERLRKTEAALYLAAHCGLHPDICPIIDENRRIIRHKAEKIRDLVNSPMTLDQIYQVVCRACHLLSHRLDNAATYERNIRSYVEYLRDAEELDVWADNGVVYYQAKPKAT